MLIPLLVLLSSLSPVSSATVELGAALLARAHSHNDYEQKRPLHDALDQRFSSVEADVYLRKGQILVSHLGFFFKGSLEELYLDPLQRLVDRNGSVYGDGRPFYLWIDLKDGGPRMRAALHALLNRYPMLTTFDGQRVVAGPVTVVLTGDEEGKAKFVQEHPVCKATRDSNYMNAGDPRGDSRWSWYAIQWSDYMRWKGDGPIPPSERKKLVQLVAAAHAKARLIRFWDVPTSENVWGAALDAGADQVSADDLPRMHRFLDGLPSGF